MTRHSAASELGHALGRTVKGAAETRWNTTGTVVAITGNSLTVTIDGADTAGVGRLTSYTPVVADVVLVAIVRGSKSVQYTAIGKIAG